eukprot:m.133988 g.133988  ORF g.133988 m.133988 type:complete len:164 (+) comp13851_c0_seq2:4221-4712(+)
MSLAHARRPRSCPVFGALGPNLDISQDRLRVRRKDQSFRQSYGWGYAVCAPLAPVIQGVDGAWRYEIVIDETSTIYGGGCELGFTSLDPNSANFRKLLARAEYASRVGTSGLNSWVLDLNGGELWSGHHSQPGDHVGVALCAPHAIDLTESTSGHGTQPNTYV